MKQADDMEGVIQHFLLTSGTPTDPFGANPVSRAQYEWMEVVKAYRAAVDIYRHLRQTARATALISGLFSLVDSCDGFSSDLAIHLLLSLQGSVSWLEQIVPGTRLRIELGLRRAIGLKLSEHEMDFWLLATPRHKAANDENRSALEFLRDLAEDDEKRRMTDVSLCQVMQLAAEVGRVRGNLDGAEDWLREAARIAQDRVGSAEWAAGLLEIASYLNQERAQRSHGIAQAEDQALEPDAASNAMSPSHEGSIADDLTQILRAEIAQQHKERFLAPMEDFIAEYDPTAEKLEKVLIDDRLLPDRARILNRARTYESKGLAGWISGEFVDAQGNPRGSFGIEDRLTVQYVGEIASTVGALLRNWQETGELNEQQIKTLLHASKVQIDWRMIEVALSHHFQGDYVSAVHIMLPQFEELVRRYAQFHGVSPKKFKGRVAGDVLLNDLINPSNEEMRSLLKPGFFDLIYWYLVNSAGPFAYRHKIAHGWIRSEDCDGSLSSMAIWLTLRLITLTERDQP